jgi:uncharacterized membrane protein
MSRLVLRGLPFVLAAGLLAVFVHIVSILIMPAVAARTGAQLLQARAGGAGGPQVIPPGWGGELPTPFADPAVAVAVCAFDLSEAPFRVRAVAGDGFTSLVVVSLSGDVVHGLSDKAAVRRSLDVLVGTDPQIRAAEALEVEDRQTQDVRLRVPMTRGMVVVRALAPRAADAAAVTENLRRTQCGTVAEG